MGLFCVNMHFRSTDDRALTAAVNRRGISEYRVLSAKNGWTSLYEAEASTQDDQRILDLTAGLSQDLAAVAIAFLCHDSDIACYWLFENGQLIDQFNSSPDYFDPNATSIGPHSGGQPDVLLRYCRPGISRDDLDAILGDQPVFAEGIIERLADALAIDEERALTDYRDAADGEGPFDSHGGDDDFGGDDFGSGDSDGGPSDGLSRTGLVGRLAKMFGAAPAGTPTDPQAQALVDAAARGDTVDIDRLLADGADIEAQAPAPLPMPESMSGISKLMPGGGPKMVMTPLLAAVVNKHRTAVEHLLDCGAELNYAHPLYGTAVHAAAGAGSADVLELLLDRGGDVNAGNARHQTPLQIVEIARASVDRLAHAQAALAAMGTKLPGLSDQLSKLTLPTEGWERCEQLLREHGAL